METQQRENMRGGEGTVTVQHLLTGDELLGHGRMLAWITIPVGASVGVHQHDDEQEFYIMVSGTGRYQHDDDFYDVGPGDIVSVDDHHTHGIVNTGDEPIVMVAAILYT